MRYREGEGLKANVAHYCRVYAREAGEAAGKRGGHRKERRQAGSERRRKWVNEQRAVCNGLKIHFANCCSLFEGWR